jgi:hypothetical protein
MQSLTPESNLVDDPLLRASARGTQSADTAALLAHVDGPARGRMLSRLQHSQGNSYVQQLVQRTAAAAVGDADENLAHEIQSRSGAGSSIDSGVLGQLESGLGADLSHVRVHTDTEADYLARSVDAVAFTSGSDIFFRHGAYNPRSSEGLHTLAHEAAHCVQQASGPVDGSPATGGVSISNPSDRFERAADEAAHMIVSGDLVPTPLDGTSGGAAIQRLGSFDAAKENIGEDEPLA